MTREEAIKLLVNATYSDEWQGNEDLTTAHNMAIKALKQQPCEDVISRAEALKVINKMDIPEDMSIFEIKSHIGVEIGTLPPVTLTHKKGKWEQYGDFWKEKYRCSECKEEQPKILCGEQIIRLWSNYCPHCGAEMESEE